MSTNTTKRKKQKTSSSSATISSSVSVESSQTLQQSWPKNNPATKQFPEGGLLHNLDQYIWDALAHIKPQLFNTPIKNVRGKRTRTRKQVAIREALNIIDLGWVAINGQLYRPAYGALFDMAEEIYRRNGWNSMPKRTLPKITKIKVEDVEWKSSKLNSSIELEDGIIKIGCANSIKSSINETGMAVIQNAIDKSTIQKLLTGEATSSSHSDATQIKVQPKINKLAYTTGNGKEGYYNDIQDNKYLSRLQSVIISSLKGVEETIKNTSDKRKYILLNYSEGGENWAHRDGNSGEYFPYQGLLMLSNSTDYDGGEFYVAKRLDNEDTNDKKKKQRPSVIRICAVQS